METEFRFVLLDLGHPMDINAIKYTVSTLENVLALGLSFPQNSKEMYLGISILNSDFTTLQSESNFRSNFKHFHDDISAFLTKIKTADKVTVPEFKYFLINSIELIFRVCEKKLKTENFCGKSRTALVNVAILTRKTGSILAYILADVMNKLQEKFKSSTLMYKYTIVQTLREEEEGEPHGVCDGNPFIKWIKCSISQNDLSYFLKDWLLSRTQKLRILLSKDVNCVLQCEVDDCLVNPVSVIFDGKLDAVYNTKPQPTISESIYNLDIVNRIPLSRFSPTFVYGIPRRIRAIRHDSTWTESQINYKMFKELCRELDRTKQGLLTKSKPARSELIRFHFLTSDGCTLLMNDVTPDELYLQKNEELSKSDSDENAALFVKNCIENIKCVEQYSPSNFTSGLYEYLRKRLINNGQSKSLFGRFDPNVKLFGHKRKKKSPVKGSITNGSKDKNLKPSMRKLNQENEYKGVHPALLPSEVVEKYRKVPVDAFKLTELEDEH